MHDLQRLGLHQTSTDNRHFIEHYLGPQVIAQLNQSPLAFAQWNDASVTLFRQLCETMAAALPSADHVIRADTGQPNKAPEAFGPLLMYFGVQLPAQGARSQFIGVGARQQKGQVSFTLFVAGAASDAQRVQRAAQEDPQGLIDGFVIANQADLERFRAQALPVLRRLDASLAALRQPHEGGFVPAICQQAWGHQGRNREAGALFWAHWQALLASRPAAEIDEIKKRLQQNNGYRKQKIISLIEQHLTAAQAFELGLSEAA
ncbi:hypothetical protein [Curvibacter gracilis]|uniref:hypothetical protein n=1 Tax=Curvibacter gracilis TaxID=230310 RepID=UPI0004878C42|nr:hypothetical protein [Curvibacter gracilis]